MKIYCVHPITGLSFDEVYAYFEGLRTKLGKYYTVLHPMTAKAYLKDEADLKASGYTFPISTNHAIIERDVWMVSEADVVYADLTGAKSTSIGCVMELAWAFVHRKHTVVVMEKQNPHQHAFVLEAADVIFSNCDEATAYLEKLSTGDW